MQLQPGNHPRPISGENLEIEQTLRSQGYTQIAGVDEAGRGACAGPLVVAACVLPHPLPAELSGLDDSKKLSARARAHLYEAIHQLAVQWAVVCIEPADIDAVGVHRCNLEGMERAVNQVQHQVALTDGYYIPTIAHSIGVIKGDAQCPSIAAASILAKVTRDRIMVRAEADYPGYGLATHKGYGTAKHQQALSEHGVTPIHRRSYANIERIIRRREEKRDRER